MKDVSASSKYDENGFFGIEINSLNDVIKLYEMLRGKKLKWYEKVWFKIENYFEIKLERIFKMRWHMELSYCISTKCPYKWVCGRNYFCLINLGEIVSEVVNISDMYHQNMVCEKFIKLWGEYGICNERPNRRRN